MTRRVRVQRRVSCPAARPRASVRSSPCSPEPIWNPLVSYGVAMAVHAGRHLLGTDRGRIILHTSRDGLAAQAGPDLTLWVGRWAGGLTLHNVLTPPRLPRPI